MCHPWKSSEILWKLVQIHHTHQAQDGVVTLERGGHQRAFKLLAEEEPPLRVEVLTT